MVTLEIINNKDYLYYLRDEYGNMYTLNLEFLDITLQPKTGNILCINKELLNPKYEGYSTNYTFGALENKYGKTNISINDIDIIKILIGDQELILKRIYG